MSNVQKIFADEERVRRFHGRASRLGGPGAEKVKRRRGGGGRAEEAADMDSGDTEAGGSDSRMVARLRAHIGHRRGVTEDSEDSGGRMAHLCYLETSEIGNISCT